MLRMTNTPSDSTRPVCPADLKAGVTYVDRHDGSTFTVAAIETRGVAVRVTTDTGDVFTYGGLYGRLYPVTPAATPAPATRIATQHGGKVHAVRMARNPWAPGTMVEVPLCARNGGNVIGTRAVSPDAEVTCVRCAGMLDKAARR